MTGAGDARRASAWVLAGAVAASVAWLAWPAGVQAADATRTVTLRLSPDTGQTGTQVQASFAIGGGGCPLASGSPVRFSWDGSPLGAAPLNATTCSATFVFSVPEGTPGHHVVVASAQGYARSAEFTQTTPPTPTPSPAPHHTSPPATLPVVTASGLAATPAPTATARPATPPPATATATATPSPTPQSTGGQLDVGPIAGACPLARAPCTSPSPSPSGSGPAGIVSRAQGPGGLGILAVALIFAGLAAVLAGRRRWRRGPRRPHPAPAAAVPPTDDGPAPGVTWPGYTVTPPRGSSRIAGGPGRLPRRPAGG